MSREKKRQGKNAKAKCVLPGLGCRQIETPDNNSLKEMELTSLSGGWSQTGMALGPRLSPIMLHSSCGFCLLVSIPATTSTFWPPGRRKEKEEHFSLL